MRNAGVPARAIDVFASFYGQLLDGATGMIREADVDPLDGIDSVQELRYSEAEQRAALQQTVVLKLNGGLGTSMGLDRAKSLVSVRGGYSFLDIIVEQVKKLRSAWGVDVPLLFMNSFRTQEDTLTVLSKYEGLALPGIPLDFLQNQEPKLRRDNLEPVDWPEDPALEWCPPGHGDLYTALETSGVLDTLLEAGFRYATVSNADNLGASPDPKMMAWFAASGAPYAAEVCRRTAADVKGGHLVVRKSDGRIVLRESAQTPSEDVAAATDLTVHRHFHTNNLWFDLVALKETLTQRNGILGLPLIRNEKTVDPTQKDSMKVIQIESAMGAAIEVFDGATAIEVDRSRFLPVKTTNDLLLLRSDSYVLTDDFNLVAQVAEQPLVNLDRRFYTTISDFEDRIPHPISLRQAESFTVHGDWHFGADVQVVGAVTIDDTGNQESVEPGTVLQGL